MVRLVPIENVDNDYITIPVAATLLNVSTKTVARMCRHGVFKSANKPGEGKQAHWRLLRADVLLYRSGKHAVPGDFRLTGWDSRR